MTTTQKPEPMLINPLCRCGDCENLSLWKNLNDIKDIGQRINAGSVVPAGECQICGSLSYVIETDLTANDEGSWLDCIWGSLHCYREDCISEGDENSDREWDEICTAMAWIKERIM